MGDVVEGEMIHIKFSLRYQGIISIIIYFRTIPEDPIVPHLLMISFLYSH